MKHEAAFRSILSATRIVLAVLVLGLSIGSAAAQDRLEDIPGYTRYVKVSDVLQKLRRSPRADDIEWTDSAVRFTRDGERYSCSLADGAIAPFVEPAVPKAEAGQTDASQPATQPAASPRPPRKRPARGRQADVELSPDGAWEAVCRDFNVVLVNQSTGEQRPVTATGTRKHKFGSASWVYGEELEQTTAMWWSPDSRRLAYYELDETGVIDFPLATRWTELRPEIALEGYPKPGEANPVAMLHVHDLVTGDTSAVNVGSDPQQYIFDVRFSPNGDELLFNRTNRHQNRLELMAADPQTGITRVVVTEIQDTWQKNRPEIKFLADGRRFIWETERSGWKQYELRNLDGSLIVALTTGDYPAERIVGADEGRGEIFYTAFSDANALSRQLHRVNPDGTGQRRITTSSLSHSDFEISGSGRHVVCTVQSVDLSPRRVLIDAESGREIAELATVDASSLDELGLEKPELLTIPAADGVTTLYGTLHKPSDFDPAKKYPLLIDVYGGPLAQSVHNRWNPGVAACEFGFLIAEIDNRGTLGRGKAFEGAGYLKLGQIDLDDQVAAVKQLATRPYVDATRVGIMGHSYGGYMAALAIVKYPDVFRAAVAGAPLTDLANYDTIYTERFMRTPQENSEGYAAASCLTYVDGYRGGLLLLQGMVDDNVHPTNVFQLAHALQKADKPFEMMLFPTSDHGIGSPMYRTLRWTFLYRKLVGSN